MGKSAKAKINVKERVEDDTIDLSLSDISEIPVREIAQFKRVKTLDLSSNKITTLGKNFGTLTHLTQLDLSKNQLKFLSEDIGKLINLRHLDLYNNKLEHLPLSFGQLKSLRYLDLKGNPLAPALARVVGGCLTTKECQDSARKTVKFLKENEVRVLAERAVRQKEDLERAAAEKEAADAEEKRQRDAEQKPKSKPKREKKIKKTEDLAVPETESLAGPMLPKKSRRPSIFITTILTILLIVFFFGLFLVSFAMVSYPILVHRMVTHIENGMYDPAKVIFINLTEKLKVDLREIMGLLFETITSYIKKQFYTFFF